VHYVNWQQKLFYLLWRQGTKEAVHTITRRASYWWRWSWNF